MSKKLSILVIDDEVALEVVYRNFLSKLDAEVTFSEHPQKAWRAIDKDEFDLIITDLKMPVITGDEFVKIVRSSKLNSHTPIIMCSAFINKLVITEMTRESKVYFLSKPFDSKSLLDLVGKATGAKRTTEAVEGDISSKQQWVDSFLISLTELSGEKVASSVVDRLDVWNFDSMSICTCFMHKDGAHTVSLLMKLNTFLKIAGKIQGTQYKEVEDEALQCWQDLLSKVGSGNSRVTFARVLSQEILNVSNVQAYRCRVQSQSIDILLHIN